MDGLAALSAAAGIDGLEPQLSLRLRHDAVHLASDTAAAPGGVAEGQVGSVCPCAPQVDEEAIEWCQMTSQMPDHKGV